MRLVTTESLKDGMKLGKPVYNEHGQVLISDGVALTVRMINRLIELGITFVYIDDPRTDDITSKSPLSEKLRKEAIQTIETTFADIKNEQSYSKAFVIEKTAKHFTDIIRSIMKELKNNQDLLTLLADVYTYDNYIFTHSLNVTMYSLAIGMELKLSDKQLETIGMGAILHDVGKMMVPLDVLMKPGKLTDKEFEEVKKHAEYGFSILRDIPTVSLVSAHCAFQHHERLDGSGYPRGIKGDDIHFFGRLLAVADVFDAVTSNRVYRDAMLPHEGLEILYAGVGSKFETKIVEAFRRSVAVYPVGLTVELNDGRKGIVAKQNHGISDRPIIRILEESGQQLSDPYEINLKEKLDLMIINCDTTQIGKLHDGVGAKR